jgi:hypothetical protein
VGVFIIVARIIVGWVVVEGVGGVGRDMNREEKHKNE